MTLLQMYLSFQNYSSKVLPWIEKNTTSYPIFVYPYSIFFDFFTPNVWSWFSILTLTTSSSSIDIKFTTKNRTKKNIVRWRTKKIRLCWNRLFISQCMAYFIRSFKGTRSLTIVHWIARVSTMMKCLNDFFRTVRVQTALSQNNWYTGNGLCCYVMNPNLCQTEN